MGPLSESALDGITDETELVRDAFASPDGLTKADGDSERHVDLTVVVVVTDERVYFVSGDAGTDASAEAGSLRYGDLASVDVRQGTLQLSTVDGVDWRVPLTAPDDPTVDGLVRHLGWIGDIRSRLVALANDVDVAVGTIRTATAEMDWERGTETYERQRNALDEVTNEVLCTRPVDADALAPDLTRIEKRLERACTDLLIERAESRLTFGQQLRQTIEYERAHDVIASARADYDAARGHAEAIQRSDAFMFGEQREIRDRLEHLHWEFQAVAAEPLRRATEARLLAVSATDPVETVRYWEAAFSRYRTVLTLTGEDGDGEVGIAGTVEDVRDELEDAAGQLIGIHRTLARTLWDEGIGATAAAEDGDAELEPLETAIDHAERAREIAADFRPDAVQEMDERLAKMRDGLERLQDAPTFTRSADSAEASDAASDETERSVRRGLAALETRHEVQIEGTIGEVAIGDTGPDRDRASRPRDHDRGDPNDAEIVLSDPTDDD